MGVVEHKHKHKHRTTEDEHVAICREMHIYTHIQSTS